MKTFACILLIAIAILPLHGQYRVNGDATNYATDCYRLTPDVLWQGGSVWYLNRIDLRQPFDLEFDIFLGCKNNNGADGIAFMLQPISTSIGQQGGGIGYLGVSPSVALELDTYQNNIANDPFFDHISLQRNGIIEHGAVGTMAGPSPIPTASGSGEIEDCNTHHMRVTWNPTTQQFAAYVDCSLALTYTGNIIQDIFNGNPRVFWGFTGSTGGFANRQEFCFRYISFTQDMPDTAICRGQSANLRAGGGDSYSWSPGASLNDSTSATPIASPTQTTTYVVTISRTCGPPRFDSITVYVDTAITQDIFPADTLSCQASAGTWRLGSGPQHWQYAWSNGDSTPYLDVPPNGSGSYNVDITNACGNYSESVYIDRPVAQIVSRPVSCAGDTDGRLVLQLRSIAVPGQGFVNYRWENAAGTVLGNRFVSGRPTGDSLSNLSAQTTYRLTVTEPYGCEATYQPLQVSEPPPLLLDTIEVNPSLCRGVDVGEIVLLAAGGVPLYRFALGSGPFQAANRFRGLPAGNYRIRVRDENDCEAVLDVVVPQSEADVQLSVTTLGDLACTGDSSGSVGFQIQNGQAPYTTILDGIRSTTGRAFDSLSAGPHRLVTTGSRGCIDTAAFVLREPPPLRLSVAAQRPADCFGDSTGTVTLRGAGGTGAYAYRISGGAFGRDSTFGGLAAGNYLAEVRDANGCVSSLTVSVGQPLPLVISLARSRDVFCKGDSSGSITLSGRGGTGPYRFALGAGAFTSDSTFSGLAAGRYPVRIRDANGCERDTFFELSEPALPLNAQLDSLIGIDCFGNANGRIQVSANGGTAPYTYALDRGAFGPNNRFTQLSGRTYVVSVRDSLGCIDTVSGTIRTPTGLFGELVTWKDLSCHGDSSGQIVLRGRGGTAPYRYGTDSLNLGTDSVLRDLPAGAYTLFLVDANNCLVRVNADILEPDSLTASWAEVRDLRCFGDNSGRLAALARGGSGLLTYSLDSLNFQPDSAFTGLPSGNYRYIVRDDSACTVRLDTFLRQPPQLNLQATSRDLRCFDDSSGRVVLRASGGVTPYQYRYDATAPGPDSVFANLSAGTYQFVVQDDSACLDTAEVVIFQPERLTLTLRDTVDVACFGEATGSVRAEALGGSQPYQWQRDALPFQNDPDFDSLVAGTYQITVRDDSGCVETASVQIDEPPQLRLQIDSLRNLACFEDGSGQLALSAVGGAGSYRFLWRGVSRNDGQYVNLPADTASAFVVDENGCRDSLAVEISQPEILVAVALGSDLRCYADSSGAIEVQATGGTAPYAYDWSDGQPRGPLAVGLPAGLYRVTLTDAQNCVASDTSLLRQPDPLILAVDTLVTAFCELENGGAGVLALGGTEPYRYQWPGIDRLGPRHFDLPGDSLLAVVVDANACRDSLRLTIPSTPPPVAFFTTQPSDSPYILLFDQPTQFINASTGGVAYRWEFGQGSGSDLAEPTFTYPQPGSYEVVLTVFDPDFACPATFRRTLVVEHDGLLHAPNAFTPNGDTHNERFSLRGMGIVEIDFRIFSRWGQEVFATQNPDAGWDGRFQGRDMPEGVYVWRAEGRFASGARFTRAGTVTLIR